MRPSFPGGVTPSLRVSRYAPWFWPPHFHHLDDLFVSQIWPCVPSYSYLVGSHFKCPPFSACRRSFCTHPPPPNRPNLSFYSGLVGSHFELQVEHPYWLLPGGSPRGPIFMMWVPILVRHWNSTQMVVSHKNQLIIGKITRIIYPGKFCDYHTEKRTTEIMFNRKCWTKITQNEI